MEDSNETFLESPCPSAAMFRNDRSLGRESGLTRREQVSELFFLRLEVVFCVRVGRNLARNALNDAHSGLLKGRHFVGVVREQADFANPKRLENLGRQGEGAMIRFEPETLVGFDGIEPGVLQFVGLEFGHETDAASLLLFVDEDSGAVVGDHRERHLELLSAVAAQRSEDVAGETLRMNANERRRGCHVAHDQRDGVFRAARAVVAERTLEAVDAEASPAGREVRGGELSNRVFRGHVFIIDGGSQTADSGGSFAGIGFWTQAELGIRRAQLG